MSRPIDDLLASPEMNNMMQCVDKYMAITARKVFAEREAKRGGYVVPPSRDGETLPEMIWDRDCPDCGAIGSMRPFLVAACEYDAVDPGSPESYPLVLQKCARLRLRALCMDCGEDQTYRVALRIPVRDDCSGAKHVLEEARRRFGVKRP